MTKTVFIYTLSDSRFPEDVRYVGCTTDTAKRLKGHTTVLNGKDHKTRWIAKVLRDGGNIQMSVVDQCREEERSDVERRWVAHFRSLGYRLTNSTDGGDGVFNPTPDVRERLSKSVSAAKIGNQDRRGTTTSPEGIENMKRAQKARGLLPEVREANRRKALASSRQNALAAWEKRSPERRKEISEKVQRTWTDPELRAKAVTNMRAARGKKRSGWAGATPEERAARVANQSAWHSDPEKKKSAAKKMSAKASAAWNDPARKADIMAKRKRTIQIKRAVAAANATVESLLDQARTLVASGKNQE